MTSSDSIAVKIDFLAGLVGFVALLFMGEWLLVLVGFVLMGVGSGAIAALLIPVERTFVALATGSVPVSLGLRSRRPTILRVGALIYAGTIFALWCSAVLSYFARSAEAGVRLTALLWSISVAMAPIRAKDRFTPMLLPMYSVVVRHGYLVMVVIATLVEPSFLVLLTAFGLMMIGAGFAHTRWSVRVVEHTMDSVDAAPSENGDASVATVTFFPTSSKASSALLDALVEPVRACGYEVQVKRDATQDDVVAACVGSGAVIFDATREKDDANYRTAMYVLNTDYAIPVSRNYLPANFPHLSPIAPPYPHTRDNDWLVVSVSERLQEMQGSLPRKPEHRGWRNAEALMDHAIERSRERRRRSSDVFLSYRGRHEEAVKRFVQRLEGGDGGHKVRYFSAGELALDDEILSLQRRWHVLRMIERWIRTATEFWVYDTEDYLDSWWTRGELILLALMDPANRPSLRVYDPANGTFEETATGLTPVPDSRQREIMHQFLFFAHQPEWSVRVRESLGDSVFAKMLDARGELFDHSFVDDPLLQCSHCTAALESAEGIDVGEFLELRYPALHRVEQPQIETALANGQALECPGCGTGHAVSTAPPRFWWYPERNGIGTGPGGIVLEERPTYRAGS